jgi:tetratricopeptide (TPR) repeat protein
MYDEAKSWYLKLDEKRDNMTDEQKIWTNNLYEKYFGTPGGQIKCYRQLLEYDDQQPQLYYMMGSNYRILCQYDKAIPEFEKFLEIYKKWDSKPPMVWDYTELGYAYHKTGQYRKERKIYRKAEKDFPDDLGIISLQATLSLTEGDVREANNYIEKYKSLCKESSWSDTDIITSLAEIYSEAGMFEKAEQYYRQALSSVELTSENSWYFYKFAWFLIDKDRNIEEGMTLVNKVLKLSPDDYDLLDTKGWGLYKQGKNREALEFLEKSWHLRMKYAKYDHTAYLHLEEAKKAVASQK